MMHLNLMLSYTVINQNNLVGSNDMLHQDEVETLAKTKCEHTLLPLRAKCTNTFCFRFPLETPSDVRIYIYLFSLENASNIFNKVEFA